MSPAIARSCTHALWSAWATLTAAGAEKCAQRGGRVRIIAAIEDPEVVEKILRHLGPEEGEHAAGPAVGYSVMRRTAGADSASCSQLGTANKGIR